MYILIHVNRMDNLILMNRFQKFLALNNIIKMEYDTLQSVLQQGLDRFSFSR